MEITPLNLQALFNAYDLSFQEGANADVPTFVDKVATQRPSSTRQNTYAWMAKLPTLREWVGERVLNAISSYSYTIVNKDFELTMELDRNDILDDTYGLFNPIAEDMGRAAKLWPDQQISRLMQAGDTSLCYDGQNFFDTDHPIDKYTPDLGVQTNLFKLDLTPDNYSLVRTTMMSYVGEDREEGTRAREHLRRGVEEALAALGQGFLSHAENASLRAELQNGVLPVKDYFNQLLRLVYRLIFLLTVEERGLLHPDGTSDATKTLYANGYGLRRLRERSVKRSAHDRFADLWDATAVVFRGLAAGEPRLGLPALAGIFAANQCAALDGAKLENRALLLAVFKLAWLREDGSLARVNWRDMGPEELGSVYESLLELVPQIGKDGRQFAFASGGETKGNARKTTGSYYTPDSLVQVLLDSALEPVIADTLAMNPANAADGLLGLAIVDPACGSGHFLLAAARRLAAHVARLQANGTPSAAEYRHALRQVVGRCIFGVDLNPMAVELCKVGLWMEAVEPGLPLSFLDSHIQNGNALLGTTPELMAKGIPDAAWEPIEGDDKKVASALKKQNKEETKSLSLDFSRPPASTYARLGEGARAVDEEDDATLGSVEAKAKHWSDLIESAAFEHQRFVADTWCAAFVWRKQAGPLRDAAPTNGVFKALQADGTRVSHVLRDEVERLREQYAWFHWPLRFPQVFAQGGFDVVLGNPPWERVKLQEQEFFASRSDEIANAANAAVRKKLIAQLSDENPQLWTDWCAASRRAEGESQWIRQSRRYPLCGKGDVNTYAIFAEHNRDVLGRRGRAGFIVPSGIATDDTTKDYFVALVREGHLAALYDYRNHDGLFYDVGHRRFKFCLVTVTGREVTNERAVFVFFAESTDHVQDPARRFTLTASDIEVLNPNTGTSPTFRSRRDADITLGVYRRAGILWREADPDGNPWGLRFMAMLHMAGDSGLFRTRGELEAAGWQVDGNHFVRDKARVLPLIEAKMVHHFDHRYGDYADRVDGSQDTQLPDVPVERLNNPSYEPMARYWVADREVDARLGGVWERRWLLGWRDIVRATDERTVIASVIPRVAVGHTTPLAFSSLEPHEVACLYACLCSFVLDYTARQKVGGTHLTYGYLKQLPVLRPSVYGTEADWSRGTTVRDWLLPRVLELTYNAWALEPFARDVGHEGPPFRWDDHRRFLLRCELDAAFFFLYEVAREDVEYVMESFPIVRRDDEKVHGKFRTKDVILEIFDAMGEAARRGTPYETRLSPPPADPRAAHAPREGWKVIPLPVRPTVGAQPVAAPTAPRRYIPAWSPDLLPAVATKTGLAATAGRWGTTLIGVDLGIAALAAVLRNMGEPASRDEVERAVVLSVLPGLLQSKLDAHAARTWRRAIGSANMNVSSIAALSIPWAEVLRRAAVEHLLVIDADGRWRAGADVTDAPSDVLDARALVALSWLESLNGAILDDADLITQLGELRAA